MPECGKRVGEEHPRAGPPHDLPDLFLHFGAVAVCGAFSAGRLAGMPVRTPVQPFAGILEQGRAAGAQGGVLFVLSAVESYHLPDYFLFFVNTVCHSVFCL